MGGAELEVCIRVPHLSGGRQDGARERNRQGEAARATSDLVKKCPASREQDAHHSDVQDEVHGGEVPDHLGDIFGLETRIQ
jgi:hypothetical protein